MHHCWSVSSLLGSVWDGFRKLQWTFAINFIVLPVSDPALQHVIYLTSIESIMAHELTSTTKENKENVRVSSCKISPDWQQAKQITMYQQQVPHEYRESFSYLSLQWLWLKNTWFYLEVLMFNNMHVIVYVKTFNFLSSLKKIHLLSISFSYFFCTVLSLSPLGHPLYIQNKPFKRSLP